MKKATKILTSIPLYIWIILFTVLPLLMILVYAVFEVTPEGVHFTMSHIKAVVTNRDYYDAVLRSIHYAVAATLVCLLLGYPLSSILTTLPEKQQNLMTVLLLLPMWMNFLIRTYAWMTILQDTGILNGFLGLLGLGRVHIIGTEGAVVIGMVYDFLPFMILPIYNTVSKIDGHLIEAAYDLGANKTKVYISVILPLAVPGIVSGITMVFIPALTTFVISNMLGGGKINLIGNIIEQEFTVNSNWYLGSGLSLVMMIFIILSMLLLQKFDKTGGENLI